MSNLDQSAVWEINRTGWDAVASRFYGAAALPNYGPFAPTEDSLQLLGDVKGQAVLDIGCGSGHSLLYLAQHSARELWGIDLSPKQIELAQTLLKDHGFSAHLLNAPMEQNPGLPEDYFDLAISIYSLGWTTDLAGTLKLIYTYLKSGGCYIFSWEHPFYTCIEYQSGAYIVKERYREQIRLSESWNGVSIVMHQRQLSTFINTALSSGFQIERLVEGEANPAQVLEVADAPDRWYSAQRAKLVPPTFILKLRKPEISSPD